MEAAFSVDRHYSQPQQVVAQPEPATQKINVKKPVPNKFKTEMCRNWVKTGLCKYGSDCTYAHGDNELHKKAELPHNLHSKFCKAYNQAPFICTKGKDCNLLHLNLTEEESESPNQFKLKSNCKYSVKLEETLNQMDKRIKQLKDFESLDLTSGIVVAKRLPIFETFAKNEEQEETQATIAESAGSAKKSSLKLKSRVFVMPSKKANTAALTPAGEQGVSTSPSFISQTESGKAQ